MCYLFYKQLLVPSAVGLGLSMKKKQMDYIVMLCNKIAGIQLDKLSQNQSY